MVDPRPFNDPRDIVPLNSLTRLPSRMRGLIYSRPPPNAISPQKRRLPSRRATEPEMRFLSLLLFFSCCILACRCDGQKPAGEWNLPRELKPAFSLALQGSRSVSIRCDINPMLSERFSSVVQSKVKFKGRFIASAKYLSFPRIKCRKQLICKTNNSIRIH